MGTLSKTNCSGGQLKSSMKLSAFMTLGKAKRVVVKLACGLSLPYNTKE